MWLLASDVPTHTHIRSTYCPAGMGIGSPPHKSRSSLRGPLNRAVRIPGENKTKTSCFPRHCRGRSLFLIWTLTWHSQDTLWTLTRLIVWWFSSVRSHPSNQSCLQPIMWPFRQILFYQFSYSTTCTYCVICQRLKKSVKYGNVKYVIGVRFCQPIWLVIWV